LLRRGECCHCRRWQQCFKNAQQQKCRNPPHVVSVHGVPAAAKLLPRSPGMAIVSPNCLQR
jgi:hypothetical protein